MRKKIIGGDLRRKWIILDLLAGVILAYRKGCVVEIGVGPSLNSSTGVLYRRAEEANVKFYTCDTSERKTKILYGLYDYSKHIHFHGTSENFMKKFNDKPSIVFIDGSHKKEMVIKEVRFFLNIMRKGGVIFLHDTFPPSKRFLNSRKCGDVYKARQELEKEMNCFTWPYTAADVGLTMIMKHDKNRPHFRM